MNRRGNGVVAGLGLTCLLVVAACGSDAKAKSGISIDTLGGTTGTACPVPFEASASASGIDNPSPAVGSVMVGAATGTAPTVPARQGTAPVEAADAVHVECTLHLSDGGEADLVLIAARDDAA